VETLAAAKALLRIKEKENTIVVNDGKELHKSCHFNTSLAREYSVAFTSIFSLPS